MEHQEKRTLEQIEALFRNAIEVFGKENQIIKSIEEMSELTTELCRNNIGRSSKQKIAEEIADVVIMMNQLIIIFDCEEMCSDIAVLKLDRLEGTLKILMEKESGE